MSDHKSPDQSIKGQTVLLFQLAFFYAPLFCGLAVPMEIGLASGRTPGDGSEWCMCWLWMTLRCQSMWPIFTETLRYKKSDLWLIHLRSSDQTMPLSSIVLTCRAVFRVFTQRILCLLWERRSPSANSAPKKRKKNTRAYYSLLFPPTNYLCIASGAQLSTNPLEGAPGCSGESSARGWSFWEEAAHCHVHRRPLKTSESSSGVCTDECHKMFKTICH